MKRWKQQIKIGKELFNVIEHTDKECGKRKTDGKNLAPISHGFVCLYKEGVYVQWCGSNFAKERIVKTPVV